MPKSFQEGKVYDIPVKEVFIGPQLLRHDPNDEDIIELAASIIERSLLEPVGFTSTPEHSYQLLYGSRRLAAFIRLKEPLIPAVYKTATPDMVKTIAIVENLQRRQLTLPEECDAVAHLHHSENLSPDTIATRLSKSRNWVLRRLAIPSLPIDLQEPLYEGRIPLGQAEELASLEDLGTRTYALAQVMQSSLSLSQTRTLVEAIKASPNYEKAVEEGVNAYEAGILAGPPKIPCQNCGQLRTITELMVLRICTDGCQQPQPTQENATNG